MTAGAQGNLARKAGAGPQVAVVMACGSIVKGKGSVGGVSNAQEVASVPMCKLLGDARNDDNVKAVVLRIDSPGDPLNRCRMNPAWVNMLHGILYAPPSLGPQHTYLQLHTCTFRQVLLSYCYYHHNHHIFERLNCHLLGYHF